MPSNAQADDIENLNTRFDVGEVVRSRLQKAETNQWSSLFAELLDLQKADQENMHSHFVQSTLADHGGEDFGGF